MNTISAFVDTTTIDTIIAKHRPHLQRATKNALANGLTGNNHRAGGEAVHDSKTFKDLDLSIPLVAGKLTRAFVTNEANLASLQEQAGSVVSEAVLHADQTCHEVMIWVYDPMIFDDGDDTFTVHLSIRIDER